MRNNSSGEILREKGLPKAAEIFHLYCQGWLAFGQRNASLCFIFELYQREWPRRQLQRLCWRDFRGNSAFPHLPESCLYFWGEPKYKVIRIVLTVVLVLAGIFHIASGPGLLITLPPLPGFGS